ncbi:MAG: GGDEF domain-containing protein [Hyphomicrobiales bacterium]|nr:GGDEF domain-containing protein [Hyphomicrobiales bacterium]
MAENTTESSTGSVSRAEIERLVLTQRVERLYASTRANLLPNAAVVGLMVWLHIDHVAIPVMVAWVAAVAVLWAIRLWLTARFQHRVHDGERSLYAWANLYIGVIGCAGLLWAVAAFAFLPGAGEVERSATALVLFGLASGAVAGLSTMLPAFLVFVLFTVGGGVAAFFLSGGIEGVGLALGGLVLVAYIIFAAVDLNRLFVSALRLSHENAALVADLERHIGEQRQLEARLRHLAITDPLTGCANRRRFLERVQEEMGRFRRRGQRFSLVLMDLDHFKAVNDTHGHPVGDRVLKAVVGVCEQQLREIDVIGRIGGEEFGILLGDTPLDEAVAVAERMRGAIEAQAIEVPALDRPIHTTASFGVSEVRDGDEGLDPLFQRVDVSMYRAKNAGRNQVAVGRNADASDDAPGLLRDSGDNSLSAAE